jgi:putative nucleotidyltransferase with HDIG domain
MAQVSSVFTTRRRGMSLVAACMLGAPVILFVLLRSFPHLDTLFMSVNFHLVVVSGIAACAVGIAIVAGVAAGRSRDYSLVLVALGCLSVGLIMLAHGLVTPGVAGVQNNEWVSRLPNFAIAAFAISQLAAVMKSNSPVARIVVRHPWLALSVPAVILCSVLSSVVLSTRAQIPASSGTSGGVAEVIPQGTAEDTTVGTTGGAADEYGTGGGYGTGAEYGTGSRGGTSAGRVDPNASTANGYGASYEEPASTTTHQHASSSGPSGPSGTENLLTDLMRLASAIILLGVGLVHWRRWRLSNDGVILALALASWLAVEALASLRFGVTWRLSWWDYHALLLLGFGSAVSAVVGGFLRTRDTDSLSHAFRHDALHHIARGYPVALRTLVAAVEARDSYTSGHSHRVTETAAAIGQRLGLRSDHLRQLVWGAELHDIGKIGISDHIIHKPGPLTAEERSLVQEHPVIGWEIARQARSLNEVLEVVRHHHEHIDGAGYPDGLVGDEIPLNARIVAIADVWDALTSDRAYRPAWDNAKALTIMEEGRGSQFDGRCLDAFLGYIETSDARQPSEEPADQVASEAQNKKPIPSDQGMVAVNRSPRHRRSHSGRRKEGSASKGRSGSRL